MTTLARCREARATLDEANVMADYPTIAGIAITNATIPGEFAIAVRESEARIFPPSSYHPHLTQLLQDHGFGDVQLSYEAVQPKSR